MAVKQKLRLFRESFSMELTIAKDRVRNLIGSAHWPTDGAYKEILLRRILRRHLPDSVVLGTGFIVMPGHPSTQLDILAVRSDKPILYREEELFFVTPDAVAAFIEVKTRIPSLSKLEKALLTISNNAYFTHQNGDSRPLWTGLLAYENCRRPTNEEVLLAVQRACNKRNYGWVNCIALGDGCFVRFWDEYKLPSGEQIQKIWVLYEIPDRAHAYFLSNAVVEISGNVYPSTQRAWFDEEDPKEDHKVAYAKVHGDGVVSFKQ